MNRLLCQRGDNNSPQALITGGPIIGLAKKPTIKAIVLKQRRAVVTAQFDFLRIGAIDPVVGIVPINLHRDLRAGWPCRVEAGVLGSTQ